MNDLLDERTVVGYLAERGLVDRTAHAEPLGGGVSNVVLAVGDAGRRLVLKQALPRLRVADEWTAPQSRASTEADALRLADRLTPGCVPVVVDQDPERYALVVEHAPDGWRDWKAYLLDGNVDTGIARRLGELLARWHDASPATMPVRLQDIEPFERLRVDPYYRTVARRAPELADPVLTMADAMANRRNCFVHGDFSPKNVLVGTDGRLWVIDFEVAHIGDPAFDLAFLLTHLTMKAIHRPDRSEAYDDCVTAFVEAYGESDWPYVLRHVGCLLLARVHGKSPAEYLTAAGQDRTWRLGTDLVTEPPERVEDLPIRREAIRP